MNLTPARRRAVRPFDLTPMIDVVLQLIIFFMFTAQFGQLTRSDIDLPRQPGEPSASTAEPALVIDVSPTGLYLVDSAPVSLERAAELARSLLANATADDVLVQVRPDRLSRAAALNALTSRLTEVGVRRWSLATRPESTPE